MACSGDFLSWVIDLAFREIEVLPALLLVITPVRAL